MVAGGGGGGGSRGSRVHHLFHQKLANVKFCVNVAVCLYKYLEAWLELLRKSIAIVVKKAMIQYHQVLKNVQEDFLTEK